MVNSFCVVSRVWTSAKFSWVRRAYTERRVHSRYCLLVIGRGLIKRLQADDWRKYGLATNIEFNKAANLDLGYNISSREAVRYFERDFTGCQIIAENLLYWSTSILSFLPSVLRTISMWRTSVYMLLLWRKLHLGSHISRQFSSVMPRPPQVRCAFI